jgi:hypothetical protein
LRGRNVIEEENVIDTRELQPEKQFFPIFFKFSGRISEERELRFRKHKSGREESEEGSALDDKEEQPKKEFS